MQPDSSVVEHSSSSFDVLIQLCKRKVGTDYSLTDIRQAISKVRSKNGNNLLGLSVDSIIDGVKKELQLDVRDAPIAPWAKLTKEPVVDLRKPEWKGPDSKILQSDQCAICLDPLPMHRTLILKCFHIFHEKCIKDWLNRQSNCPNCRTYAVIDDNFPSLQSQ